MSTKAGVFDQLVKNLSSEERSSLLKKMSSSGTSLPILEAPVPLEVPEWQEVYQGYGFLRRFILWLRGIFKGTDLATLVQEQQLEDLAASIEHKSPGFFSLRLRLAHASFYQELKNLFDALIPFGPLFKTAFGTNKQDFIAFLVGCEWPEIQAQLVSDTDYTKIAGDNSEKSVKDIKSIVEGNFRILMDSVPADLKKQLYYHLKDLFAFKELCLLTAEKYLNPFLLVTIAGQAGNANLSDLRDPLADLCDRLYALHEPPAETHLRALYLFHHRERLENPDADMENPLQLFLEKSMEAWEAISRFHKTVPLASLMAFLNNSTTWHPRESGGVEDWFQQFRRFWQGRVDRAYEVFSRERMARLVFLDINQFLEIGEEEFHKEVFYPPFFHGLLPIKGDITVRFLKLFMEKQFVPRLNPVLKIVLLEGDFYKRNNRGVFTDCYNAVLQISDQITAVQRKFEPEGEWGNQLEQCRSADDEATIAKMRDIYLWGGDWYDQFFSNLLPHLYTFNDVLRGILRGSTGGKYDTLANLNSIGGKANGVFRKELESVVQKWEKLLQILKDISPIDT